MPDSTNPTFTTELFTGHLDQGIAVVRVRDRLLLRLADLSAKGVAMEHLYDFTSAQSIRAMVILDPHQASSKEEYADILVSLQRQDSSFAARLCNAANQFVLELFSLDKPVVAAGKGRIVSLLLNMGLAADYRVVSRDAVFVNPGLNLGLPSKGGAAFFLNRLAGPARAMEFMLRRDEISAREALDMGIVNRVVDAQELERIAMETAVWMAGVPASAFGPIKTMLAGDRTALERCLAQEDEAIVRRLNTPEFWQDVNGFVSEFTS